MGTIIDGGLNSYQAELEGMCSQVRTWERDKYAEIFCMGEINFSRLALI
jgi:hypothetical protein